MLIFTAGQTPIYGKQILYFMAPVRAARALIPAPGKVMCCGKESRKW
jgi:type IV secretion system protein VirD4